MKIFFAGTEIIRNLKIVSLARAQNVLMSFFYLPETEDCRRVLFDHVNENGIEMICDSGLFTMMFGSEKSKTYDLADMKEYTKKYIAAAKNFRVDKLAIVESDVHKILGMEAVFELRKLFEDSGLNVIYVWHREEGIEGLIEMSKRYEYIALSVPELRILFKDSEIRYQDAVFDLLRKIRDANKRMPKIHLLGNTVPETMETRLAYSCDSTSWKAAERFGRSIIFVDGKFKTVHVDDPQFRKYIDGIFDHFHIEESAIKSLGYTDIGFENTKTLFVTALSFQLFQDHLNKNFPWIGLEER